MRAKALFVLAGALFVGPCPFSPVPADDDPLPNFNAPVDNSPLNVAKVNRAFGIPMFQAPSLWNEDDVVVSRRLGWPEESRTSTLSSFRLYPDAKKPLVILGARAYSCVFYATKDQPTEVSIVFVNQGDYDWRGKVVQEAVRLSSHGDSNASTSTTDDANSNAAPDQPDSTPKVPSPTDNIDPDIVSEAESHVNDDFEKALKQDAQTITDALTGLFGDPAFQGFGGGSGDTREQVKRWDWQGHALLLSTPRDTYVTLRIVPTGFADEYGKADDVDHDALKALLLQRVGRTNSGDVVVNEIPMVDQGPKGYCVPATWERYLRYLGIPADMYVLAMAAGTSQRGTNLDAMVQNVDSLVSEYHRRIDNFPGDLDMQMISKNIDSGLPLMWSCWIHVPFERHITVRMKDRGKVTDWNAWAAQLKSGDDLEIAQEITGTPVDGGHQRMIIGYNTNTNEIAISDSWSKAFAIRWMTLPEAQAINAGQSYVISY
jgi:hypothetical protein